MKVEESLNITFDETPSPPKTSSLEDDELVEEEAIEIQEHRWCLHVYGMLPNISGFQETTSLHISTTEAEYVSAGKACQQALWMKQALVDYDVRFDEGQYKCD
ncbi:hypothetical protein Tco_0210942 [Tanacetum coccineum]